MLRKGKSRGQEVHMEGKGKLNERTVVRLQEGRVEVVRMDTFGRRVEVGGLDVGSLTAVEDADEKVLLLDKRLEYVVYDRSMMKMLKQDSMSLGDGEDEVLRVEFDVKLQLLVMHRKEGITIRSKKGVCDVKNLSSGWEKRKLLQHLREEEEEVHVVGVCDGRSVDVVTVVYEEEKVEHGVMSVGIGDEIGGACMSREKTYVISHEGVVHVKDAASLVTLKLVHLHTNKTTCVSFVDHLRMLVGDDKGVVELLKLHSLTYDRESSLIFDYHAHPIKHLSFHVDAILSISSSHHLALHTIHDHYRPLLVNTFERAADRVLHAALHPTDRSVSVMYTVDDAVYCTLYHLDVQDDSLAYRPQYQHLVDHAEEYSWRCLQYMNKVNSQFSLLENGANVKEQEEKSYMHDVANYVHVLLLHRMEGVAYYRKDMLPLADDAARCTCSIVLNKMLSLISRYLVYPALHTGGMKVILEADGTGLEGKLKQQWNVINNEVVDESMDTKTRKIVLAKSREKLMKIVDTPIKILEDILKEKSDVTQMMHIYYKAAEYGTLKYEQLLHNKTYKLEDEYAFVKMNFDVPYDLTYEYYRIAKELYKKKHWRMAKKKEVVKEVKEVKDVRKMERMDREGKERMVRREKGYVITKRRERSEEKMEEKKKEHIQDVMKRLGARARGMEERYVNRTVIN